MLLLALAIAPGIAIVWFIYLKDKYDREPKKYLVVSFLLGMLSIIPAIIIELLGKKIFGDMNSADSVVFYAFYAFIIVGCSEELSKFLMLRLYAYPKQVFNEPFDGIVYSVMVAMGFATVENILYVTQNGIGTALVRMFLSVPAHASFGVLMGYYMGLAKFNKERAIPLMRKGIFLAILFHGSFDFFLFLQNNSFAKQYVSEGLLILGALVSYYLAVRLSMRSIRLHQELSRLDFEHRRKEQQIGNL
jgi:RsiW-degrading membrane proteinase PrsW (M82 family)